MTRIFISYSSKDAGIAEEIHKKLKELGHEVWWDKSNILGGQHYVDEIWKGIAGTDVFMPLLSPYAVNSPWVWREIHFAITKEKTIAPILIKFTELPERLAFVLGDIQRVDFEESGNPYDDLSNILSAERDATKYLELGKNAHARYRSLRRKSRALFSSPFALVAITLLVAWFLAPHLPTPGDILTPGASAVSHEVLTVAYTEPLTAAASPSSAVTALFGPRSGDGWQVLESGQDLSSDDRYSIAIYPKRQVWCYVFQIDATGRCFSLFPETAHAPYSSGRNPIRPGEWTLVPNGDEALYLDETLGVEHIYVAVAGVPWPELERALARAAGEEKSTGTVLSPFTTPSRGVEGKEKAAPPTGVLGTGDNVLQSAFATGVKGALIREFHFNHISPSHTGSAQ